MSVVFRRNNSHFSFVPKLKRAVSVLLHKPPFFYNFRKSAEKNFKIYPLPFALFYNVLKSCGVATPNKVNIAHIVTVERTFYVSALFFEQLVYCGLSLISFELFAVKPVDFFGRGIPLRSFLGL